jgi:hypothetical protein
MPNLRKLAALLVSGGFSVYLAKGKLNWIPDWFPVLVMACGGFAFLLSDGHVRALMSYWFKTEAGMILHPSTYLPINKPQLKFGRTIVLIFSVLTVSTLSGIAAWRYRANSLRVERVTLTPPQNGWFVSYGVLASPTDTVRAVIDTKPLAGIADYFYTLIAVRLDDRTIDPMADTTIEKSRAFSIAIPAMTIDTKMSTSFMQRALPQPAPGRATSATITEYLLLVPNDVRPDKISALKDLRDEGGHILGTASMTIAMTAQLVPRSPTPGRR